MNKKNIVPPPLPLDPNKEKPPLPSKDLDNVYLNWEDNDLRRLKALAADRGLSIQEYFLTLVRREWTKSPVSLV